MITLSQLPPGHRGRAYLTGSTTWFAVQSDARFSYGLYVPEEFVSRAPHPVVVVHGTSRRAQELRAAWVPWAERHQPVIVAPLFPAGITGPDDLDSYKTIGDGSIRYDQVLFDLLDEIAARWGLDVARGSSWPGTPVAGSSPPGCCCSIQTGCWAPWSAHRAASP
jgi:hypothetical protein